MTKRWVLVVDTDDPCKSECYINIDHISMVDVSANTIAIDSITGYGNGLIHTTRECIERIMGLIKHEIYDETEQKRDYASLQESMSGEI